MIFIGPFYSNLLRRSTLGPASRLRVKFNEHGFVTCRIARPRRDRRRACRSELSGGGSAASLKGNPTEIGYGDRTPSR